MLAAVVPSVNAKWEIKEVSTPKPGANQVLIKCNSQFNTIRFDIFDAFRLASLRDYQ
jgi:hypothetical protein